MSDADALDRLLERLQALGWVSGITWDRQDVTLAWTTLGRAQFADFLGRYRAAVPDATAGELRCLSDHLYYFGIKKRSRRSQLEVDVDSWLQFVVGDTVTVINRGETRTFAKSPSGPLIDHLELVKRGGMTMCGNTITLE